MGASICPQHGNIPLLSHSFLQGSESPNIMSSFQREDPQISMYLHMFMCMHNLNLLPHKDNCTCTAGSQGNTYSVTY